MKRAFWILLLLLAVSVAVNVWLATRETATETTIERDTMWRDSMIYLPQPAETVNTGRVVYIRIPTQVGQSPCADDSLSHTGDSPHVSPDSIDVPVPIVQKRYDDSLYTAWVSGFEPALDSIDLRLPTITETITKTITRPAPLITFGIQAGAGWGIFNQKPDIFIGVGGQVNLFRK